MEWYYVVAIIAAFVALVITLVYLGKKGIISSEMMGSFKTLVAGLSDLVGVFARKDEDNQAINMLDKAMELLEKAVLAAENMWYNGQISADERYSTCLDIFTELLQVYGIQVEESFVMVMQSLISAACENMGHMRMTKAELEQAAQE